MVARGIPWSRGASHGRADQSQPSMAGRCPHSAARINCAFGAGVTGVNELTHADMTGVGRGPSGPSIGPPLWSGPQGDADHDGSPDHHRSPQHPLRHNNYRAGCPVATPVVATVGPVVATFATVVTIGGIVVASPRNRCGDPCSRCGDPRSRCGDAVARATCTGAGTRPAPGTIQPAQTEVIHRLNDEISFKVLRWVSSPDRKDRSGQPTRVRAELRDRGDVSRIKRSAAAWSAALLVSPHGQLLDQFRVTQSNANAIGVHGSDLGLCTSQPDARGRQVPCQSRQRPPALPRRRPRP